MDTTYSQNERQPIDTPFNRKETLATKNRGRPQTRWSADIKRIPGHDWI